jgi:hypothetical membrane protein
MMQRLACGGVIGPGAFITAWAIGAAVTDREYHPLDDTISRLAAVGADTRALMTAGMIVFGLGLSAYSVALRTAVPGRAWIAAAITGISTLFVAALPVDHSDLVDRLHFAAAGIGYVSLAAIPMLAYRPLRQLGFGRLALLGAALAAVSSVALPTSLLSDQTGLFQRLGLTATDLFVVAAVPAIRKLLATR